MPDRAIAIGDRYLFLQPSQPLIKIQHGRRLMCRAVNGQVLPVRSSCLSWFWHSRDIMTIVFALGNLRQVVLISDRRLTRNGKLVTDESNKGGLITCLNGRFAFGFTGLGSVGKFETLPWLVETLREVGSPDFQFGGLLDRLKERADARFRTFGNVPPQDKRLSVLFAGYIDSATGPIPACAMLTNFQRPVEDDRRFMESQDRARDEFSLFTLENPVLVRHVGNGAAIRRGEVGRFVDLLRDKNPPWSVVARIGSEYLRELADRRLSQGLIGKQLTSIAISPDKSIPHAVAYHTDVVRAESKMPAEIVLLPWQCTADANITLTPDPDGKPVAVPKMHREAQCSCGSGLIFKECHGAPKGQDGLRIW